LDAHLWQSKSGHTLLSAVMGITLLSLFITAFAQSYSLFYRESKRLGLRNDIEQVRQHVLTHLSCHQTMTGINSAIDCPNSIGNKSLSNLITLKTRVQNLVGSEGRMGEWLLRAACSATDKTLIIQRTLWEPGKTIANVGHEDWKPLFKYHAGIQHCENYFQNGSTSGFFGKTASCTNPSPPTAGCGPVTKPSYTIPSGKVLILSNLSFAGYQSGCTMSNDGTNFFRLGYSFRMSSNTWNVLAIDSLDNSLLLTGGQTLTFSLDSPNEIFTSGMKCSFTGSIVDESNLSPHQRKKSGEFFGKFQGQGTSPPFTVPLGKTLVISSLTVTAPALGGTGCEINGTRVGFGYYPIDENGTANHFIHDGIDSPIFIPSDSTVVFGAEATLNYGCYFAGTLVEG